ncbi:uncharacterized protein LOC131804645 [Musca domestica]|uniref:Uncharacterized protein LOC101900378 n=1 Tax=Musca domestica TaxID=7370 RepID=A0ABM3VD15_MUSDO|nr:uncharacterized protein LOC101900378 [Musca domestica]XP_058983685.1 uncharacterized protein LOC131804645 [Musca domestica]
MKFAATVIFFAFAYINLAHSKSLKNYYANSVTEYKGQRKPLASPMANGIHDSSYTRSKRQIPQAIQDLQDLLTNTKKDCAKELGFGSSVNDKTLLYEENPTPQEKCLMACILRKVNLMDKNNRLSVDTIARIAGSVSQNNELVISVAVATANNCNNLISTNHPCEAAAQINKCIGGALKANKLKLFY